MLAVAGAFSSFPVMKHCNLSSSLVTGDAVSWVTQSPFRVDWFWIGIGVFFIAVVGVVGGLVLFCFVFRLFIYLFLTAKLWSAWTPAVYGPPRQTVQAISCYLPDLYRAREPSLSR